MQIHVPEAGGPSDKELKLAATRALDQDPTLARAGIKVAVAEGWVTLTGEMSLAQQRAFAERIVRGIFGVRGVINSIVVPHIGRRGWMRKPHGLSHFTRATGYAAQRMAR